MKRKVLVTLGVIGGAVILLFIVNATAAAIATPAEGEFDYASNADARQKLGCPDSAIDREGTVYKTVAIGEQCWFAENLAVSTHRDGSEVVDSSIINLEKYGRLYRFSSVANPAGLCPEGWRVPSDADIQALETFLGMPGDELNGLRWRGDKVSQAIKKYDVAFSWTDEEKQGINNTGFALLPAGETLPVVGAVAEGSYAGLWTSTVAEDGKIWARYITWNALHPSNTGIWRRTVNNDSRTYSVRCLQGEPTPEEAP
jgi:uncharacterized protein (TIGR02145 family)